MGYILTTTAVDLGKVADAVGSKNNKRLVSALVKKFGDEFEQFDEMAAEAREDEDGREALTMQGALTQMVMGEEYNEEFGFMYGYALEYICRHFGKFLPNEEWSAMPSGSDWAETVDRGLEAAGVPESVLRVGNHLMYRGSPIPVPEIEDFPAIGYLKRKEVKAAQKSLGQAKLAVIKDKEVLASIRVLQSWLQTCADSGRDLVCFYA
jgi:hypothetical protein